MSYSFDGVLVSNESILRLLATLIGGVALTYVIHRKVLRVGSQSLWLALVGLVLCGLYWGGGTAHGWFPGFGSREEDLRRVRAVGRLLGAWWGGTPAPGVLIYSWGSSVGALAGCVIVCRSLAILLVPGLVAKVLPMLKGARLAALGDGADTRPRRGQAVGTLCVAVAMVIFAWVGFAGIPGVVCGLALAVLGAMSVIRWLPTIRAATEPPVNSERARVLTLLEAGKISAEESAELLGALREDRPTSQPLTPTRKLALLGAALVAIGFLLPWFKVDVGAEINRVAGASHMAELMPMGMVMLDGKAVIAEVYGGDIAHGLGWLVLMLAGGAAGLPFFATGMNKTLQRRCTLLALAAGSFFVLYLLSKSFSAASWGMALVVAGYAVETGAVWAEMA